MDLVIARRTICSWCKGRGFETNDDGISVACLHCQGMGSYLTHVDGGKVRAQMKEILK